MNNVVCLFFFFGIKMYTELAQNRADLTYLHKQKFPGPPSISTIFNSALL